VLLPCDASIRPRLVWPGPAGSRNTGCMQRFGRVATCCPCAAASPSPDLSRISPRTSSPSSPPKRGRRGVLLIRSRGTRGRSVRSRPGWSRWRTRGCGHPPASRGPDVIAMCPTPFSYSPRPHLGERGIKRFVPLLGGQRESGPRPNRRHPGDRGLHRLVHGRLLHSFLVATAGAPRISETTTTARSKR